MRTAMTANTENNTIMNTDIRELTLDELEEVSGASLLDAAALVGGAALGGLAVAAYDAVR